MRGTERWMAGRGAVVGGDTEAGGTFELKRHSKRGALSEYLGHRHAPTTAAPAKTNNASA